ncbi:RICIN domain-containing protein [Streptomyces sp. NPDC059832]|uniref:RICIN domain-containing protein n=1 Tax=unclassified Streptomyces TaxID=2593676 RepID=UPI00364FBBD9
MSGPSMWSWAGGCPAAAGSPGKCLEIQGDSTANGAGANQWDCNGSATQSWR